MSTVDGFHGSERSVIILDLVKIEELRFIDQELCKTVAFSNCRDSFIIVSNTAIIDKEKFWN